jgi:hypothetical protein
VTRTHSPSIPSFAGRPPIGPLVGIVGLAILATLSLGLFTGQLPLVSGAVNGPGSHDQPIGADPNRTPTPSNVVLVAPSTNVPGSFVFAKKGNIWLETAGAAKQITSGGDASMPSWSPDGQWIYYIQTLTGRGYFPNTGTNPVYYNMTYPVLWRVHPDGSAPHRLTDGVYHPGPRGSWTWFYWLRQPVPSPNGHTIALVSDAPDPASSDVVLQFYDTKTGKLTKPPLPEDAPLGHQDPAWSLDGKTVAYVFDSRDGTRGTPELYLYTPATGHNAELTGPGYLSPSFSPDGKYLAATKTSAFGTDIVILDAHTGAEVLTVTVDGQSWDPVWSPAGDAIAFLHLSYQTVDLRVIPLVGTGPRWTLGQAIDLTRYSGLDGASRPGWYISPAELSTLRPQASGSASP